MFNTNLRFVYVSICLEFKLLNIFSNRVKLLIKNREGKSTKKSKLNTRFLVYFLFPCVCYSFPHVYNSSYPVRVNEIKYGKGYFYSILQIVFKNFF